MIFSKLVALFVDLLYDITLQNSLTEIIGFYDTSFKISGWYKSSKPLLILKTIWSLYRISHSQNSYKSLFAIQNKTGCWEKLDKNS